MKYFLVVILSAIVIVGCEIDNYDEAQLTLSGKIKDAQTNQLVESGGTNGGTVLKIYEGNSLQPLIYKTFPNGSFKNSRIFAGEYNITIEGPFEIASEDTMHVEIKDDTSIEFKVVPNIRLKTTVEEMSDKKAKVKVEYKVNSEQEFADIGIVWSTFKNPNIFTFAGGDLILKDASTFSDTVSGEKEFIIENLNSDMTYYLRACASTNNPGNYYNYSSQVEL